MQLKLLEMFEKNKKYNETKLLKILEKLKNIIKGNIR